MNEKVIALLLNWISENVTKEDRITVRIVEEDTKDVYELCLKAHKGCLRVATITLRDDLKGKLLYHWMTGAVHRNISIGAIKKSMEVADLINAQDAMYCIMLIHSLTIKTNSMY